MSQQIIDPVFRPRVTVASVVADQGRFLIVEERIESRLVLNQPSGHLEPGETLLEAGIRECFEESGYRIEPLALLKVYQTIADFGRPTLRFTIAARLLEHDPTATLDHGIERVLWLSPAELAARRSDHRSAMVGASVEAYQSAPWLPLAALCPL